MFDLVRRLNLEDGGGGSGGGGGGGGSGGAGGGGGGGSGGGSRTVSLENARLGTMHVVNRFYRPVEWAEAGAEEVATVEADLVVNFREARRARVLRAEEGRRPVSGARRLAVWLVGEDALEVAPES